MSGTIGRSIMRATLALALVTTVVGLGIANWPASLVAQAQGTVSAPIPRTITVVGDGRVNIEPDVARANIGVEVVKSTVEEATAENTRITNQVLEALQSTGVAPEDIQTSGYSVYAERYGADGQLPADETQYRVNNAVTVLIRNLGNVGPTLDAAVKAGANNIFGVEFLLEDSTDARSEARALAMANAVATAEELAALAGVKVGSIISISEVIAGGGGIYQNEFAQYAVGRGGGGTTPIEPGQLRLTMQLQVTYELVE